jgi:type I restriction enzyme, R subunit
VRYKLAFERYLAENGYSNIRPLVAFSGTVRDPETGIDYTEPGMNVDIVTGRPISEAALPERFGTHFNEEDRLFFQQIKERACNSERVIPTALANPLDKFELGIRKLIEDLMIERMGENDKIVTRYMADPQFQASAFPILAREIFDVVRVAQAGNPTSGADEAQGGSSDESA